MMLNELTKKHYWVAGWVLDGFRKKGEGEVWKWVREGMGGGGRER